MVEGTVQTVTASARSPLVAASIFHENDGVGEVEILSLPDLKLAKRLDAGSGRGTGIGFSPDDELIAVGGEGSTRLYKTGSWQPHGRALVGHSGARIVEAIFSGDGRLLATAGADGAARLWDVASQAGIGAEMPVEVGSSELGAAFVLGGTRLITVSDAGARLRVGPAHGGLDA